MIHSLWRKRPGEALGRRGRLANPRVRPRLEVLEGRTLLSVLTVLNNNDSGPDSLRDALSRAANGDVINFDKSLAGSTITLTSGELSVAASVKIQGLGADQLTVSGNGASRVFNVASGVTSSLSGLRIAWGTTGGEGGGVWNRGTLSVSACTFYLNFAGVGGAVGNDGILTLDHDALQFNSAGEGGGLYDGPFLSRATVSATVFFGDTGNNAGGGAVAAEVFSQVSLNGCTFLGNDAGGYGGGVLNDEATVNISASTFAGNSTPASGAGGAVAMIFGSTTTIDGCTFTANSAGGGGAVFNGGTATSLVQISTSTFTDNTATDGGAIFSGLWAGIGTGPFGTVTVDASTFSRNSATVGGAVFNAVATMTITDSTLDHNQATTKGGGAIYNQGADASHLGVLTVTTSTLFGNSAAINGGAITNGDYGDLTVESATIDGNAAGTGGGVFLSPLSAATRVHNTIIAVNAASDGGPDVSGAVQSQGYNLIGVSDGSTGWTDTDLLGTADNPIDPVLGALQDNGGPTFTQALLSGSLAIAAGDPDLLGTFDQRGVERTDFVDIGAFQT
jgi:predicted outer membrane repeat protein